MLIFTVVLILSAFAVDTQSKNITLEGLLRDHCENYERRQLRGPPGIQGWPGYNGRDGINGLAGPPGFQNDTKIRETFQSYMEAVFRTLTWSTSLEVRLESCQDISTKLAQLPNIQSGVYELYHPVLGWTNVYCDLSTDGEGWTVFQRRMDGSVDFFRGWGDYVHGFGDRSGEFWLGLEKIHHMTRYGNYELRIDMTEVSGTQLYAKYRSFRIAPSGDRYRISVSGYSGNATNAFAHRRLTDYGQNNQQFSTFDADHDRVPLASCAEIWSGAWWYNGCLHTNLNGVYSTTNHPSGVSWRDIRRHKYMYMKFTEMKFRPVL